MVRLCNSSNIFSWVILGGFEGLCQDEDEGLKGARRALGGGGSARTASPAASWGLQLSTHGPPHTTGSIASVS